MILSARLSPPFLLLLLLLSSAFFAWSSRVTKCSIAKPLDGAAGRFEARAQRIYLVYAIAPRSPLARSFVFCSSSSTLLLLCAISPALLLLLLCARASIARVVFPRRGIPPLDSWLSVSEGLWSSSSLFPLRSSLFALPLPSPSSLSLFPLPLLRLLGSDHTSATCAAHSPQPNTKESYSSFVREQAVEPPLSANKNQKHQHAQPRSMI